MNAVERMYEAFPAFLYFNASILSGLLEPLLETEDILTAKSYTIQDIGIVTLLLYSGLLELMVCPSGSSFPIAAPSSSSSNANAGVDRKTSNYSLLIY